METLTYSANFQKIIDAVENFLIIQGSANMNKCLCCTSDMTGPAQMFLKIKETNEVFTSNDLRNNVSILCKEYFGPQSTVINDGYFEKVKEEIHEQLQYDGEITFTPKGIVLSN